MTSFKMSAATTRIDWRRSCFGILKMTKLRFDLVTIAIILCLQLNLCRGEEKNDTTKVEGSQLNVTNKCAIEANEQLMSYVNDSLNLCSSPQQTINLLSMTELCKSFNSTYIQLCEMSNVIQLNVSRKNFCDNFTTNSTSVRLLNIDNKEQCLNSCVNNTEPKTFSLCVLTKLALETSTKPVEPVVVMTVKPSVSAVDKSTKVDDVSPKSSTTSVKVSSSPSVTNEKTSDANIITPAKDVYDEEPSKFTISPEGVDGDQLDDSNDEFDTDNADEFQVEKTAPSGKETPAAKDETKTSSGQEKSTFSIGYPDDGNSHFFVYFLTVVVICIIGYVLYHNKKKVIALIVEGRQERRRRPNTNLYRKLDSNLEEVMHSTGNGAETNGAKRNTVIY